MIQFDVLLFAGAAQLVGSSSVSVQLSKPEPTVADVAQALLERNPAVSGLLRVSRWAVDRQFVETSTILRGGEEIALIPPVSGG